VTSGMRGDDPFTGLGFQARRAQFRVGRLPWAIGVLAHGADDFRAAPAEQNGSTELRNNQVYPVPGGATTLFSEETQNAKARALYPEAYQPRGLKEACGDQPTGS